MAALNHCLKRKERPHDNINRCDGCNLKFGCIAVDYILTLRKNSTLQTDRLINITDKLTTAIERLEQTVKDIQLEKQPAGASMKYVHDSISEIKGVVKEHSEIILTVAAQLNALTKKV